MDGPFKILLVEDDPDQASLMKDCLCNFSSRFDVEISFHRNARSKLTGNPYEVIIVDFPLPGKSGLKTLNQMLNGGVETPVVVVSSDNSEQLAVEALNNGANDYIAKEDGYLSTLPKVVQKIIEKHHLEIQLRESERKYQNIFENAIDSMLIIDAQRFTIEDANMKTTEIIGCQKTQLIGKSFTALFPTADGAEVEHILKESVEEGLFSDDNLSILSSDGLLIPVEINVSTISFGQCDHILCNVRNIAEKKHLQTLILNSKRRLQNTFDGIEDAIFEVNPEHEIIIANKEFASQCQDQPENLIGRKCYDVYYNCQAPCDDCSVAITFGTGEPRMIEREHNGEIFEISSYPIFAIEGAVESVAVYAKNITERRKLAKSLIQSEKLASIGLLASGIAHELRNPLNVIETARYYISEFLHEKDSDIPGKLEIIRKNVRRSSNIISNLLEFSRHSEHARESIHLSKLIGSTVALIRKELTAKNIEYVFEGKENLHAIFSMDSLKQVLLNIVINAMQAMPEGGRLGIAVERVEEETVVIKISDTGMGIPVENLRHIFSPFFTTKEVGVGTGLGLYICHMIVEREGGRITVQSNVDRGTTFCLSLPSSDPT